jgi:predicted DNA-binding transcriptional regulator AlpA
MKRIKAHPEATAAPPDKNLHIDKRLPGLLEDLAGGHPDELRDTVMTAAWLGVSTMFLIKGRMEGYGPKYIRVGANAVRYRRSDVIAWLEERTFRRYADEIGRRESAEAAS